MEEQNQSEFENSVLKPGSRLFQRFVLQRRLGIGGMGEVWLALDVELERDVALKFMSSTISQDPEAFAELKRETKNCLELTHPNIVRIYDFLHEERHCGISMEFVDGETLFNILQKRPSHFFEPETIKHWVHELCAALEYAHQHQGIVHRDLKSANLMINSRSQIKIADFGTSLSITDAMSWPDLKQKVGGTLVYMSPQQLTGQNPNPLDDIYSVGGCLYELLTGKQPFLSEDLQYDIFHTIPPLISERRKELWGVEAPLSAEWEEAIASCLSKDEEGRPQSMMELAERLALLPGSARRAKGATTKIRIKFSKIDSVAAARPHRIIPPTSDKPRKDQTVPLISSQNSPEKGMESSHYKKGILAAAGVLLLGTGLVGGWYLRRPVPQSAVPHSEAHAPQKQYNTNTTLNTLSDTDTEDLKSLGQSTTNSEKIKVEGQKK
ncbi:MAG: serine/threonine-protein kinase [Verrucomicrobiota bacterium]|nr:serine/threonine-protein kinase [Verrucomicrobiota bacterium]